MSLSSFHGSRLPASAPGIWRPRLLTRDRQVAMQKQRDIARGAFFSVLLFFFFFAWFTFLSFPFLCPQLYDSKQMLLGQQVSLVGPL